MKLPKSREIAQSCLNGIERKLKRNDTLAKSYQAKKAHYKECSGINGKHIIWPEMVQGSVTAVKRRGIIRDPFRPHSS